jgi:hypothetical protein
MVQMPVRYHYGVDLAVVNVPTQLGKCAGAEVDYEARCATLNEVPTAPLSRVWAGGAAS